jgi:hypothetical protein
MRRSSYLALVLGAHVLSACVAEVESLGFDARRASPSDARADALDGAGPSPGDGGLGLDGSTPSARDAEPTRPDGGPSVGDGGRPDSGRPDGGARDGGPRDAGPPRPCSGTGQEGCGCNPDLSCALGLACVEWTAFDTGNPTRSCVRPCADDRACAASTAGNAVCRAFVVGDDPTDMLPATSVVMSLCASADAARAQTCIGARTNNRTMTGCGADLTCVTPNTATNRDDEGVCAELCLPTAADPSGGCRAPTPHCNPSGVRASAVSTGGALVPYGVCATRPIRQGERCSLSDPARGCDQSALTVLPDNLHACINFPDLPADEGICVEVCRRGGACALVEPGLGPATCTPYIDEASDPEFALCAQACSSFPDTCGGAGATGAGRFCSAIWAFDQAFPLAFCMDRATPTLMAAQVPASGVLPAPGSVDDCRPGVQSEGAFYRCPEGTSCFTLQEGSPNIGACLRGCDPMSPMSSCGAGTCVQNDTLGGGLCTGP